MKCPCGSEKNYESCCGKFIKGEELPPTPEALMRSRYVAYTQKNFAYIEETMSGPALEAFDRKRAEDLAKETKWLKLEVLSSHEQGDEGTVQFMAFFESQGRSQMMHEVSTFKKIKGKWMYIQGEVS